MAGMRASVVTVHGWHMPGLELALLERRLRAAGLEVYRFHYASRRQTPEQAARALAAFIEAVPGDLVHLVAHSLGGIIVRHLFTVAPVQRPGRIVMLGSPLAGSRVAARLARNRLGRWWLGAALDRGLLGGSPVLRGREIGMIAGSRPLGPAPLFAQMPPPHDGFVAVDETRGPDVTRHLTLPISHTGMLFDATVARETLHFLDRGDFLP
ncbi:MULTISPECIES: triacylglycerol lipase [unclassified Thioalkalivibrio]|uniref:esterase/lipase family protein n=1 Tax=unclassified Thioalkalivibrio TaxID=2621013 RepID=UPI000362100C|nr:MULTISPECIES: alpha/beta fold hydrolase [unclassified Thioalkalivibrio]